MIHCVGIKWGNKFSPEYINKLFRGIRSNTTKEFIFTCFTDNPLGIEYPEIAIRPLQFFTGDWFTKIGLYNKNLYKKGDQIFYFDLDTVVVGNLDEIFDYSGNFMILRDFYRAKGYGSGLMSWRPSAVHHMWENYTRGTRCAHGDQGWPELQYPNADIWQEKYPQKIISYKVHIKNRGKLKNPNYTNYPGSLETASIVCFHGKPMPHEVKESWMLEHWK